MKLPKIVIPAIVVTCAALTVPLKGAFNYPAAQMTVSGAGDVNRSSVRQVEMIVSGVKCQGTANFFLSRYRNLDGVLDLTAYAADHKVIITYDAAKLSPDRLKAIGEAPVQGQDGAMHSFFVVEKLKER